MAAERFNGIKVNVDRLTDDELLGMVDHQTERLYHTENDLNKLIGHAAARGLIQSPEPGEVVSLDDYRQGKLFEMPDGAA